MNKVTIVTVTYNCELILENTIQSVINQTYRNTEYIIVDGASKDGTVSIIKKYENKFHKWISEPDEGIFDAMNKGLKMATGDWIIFMNAGDVFSNESVLENVFGNSDLNEVSVIYGRTDKITQKGFQKGVKPIPFFEQKTRFKSMGFCHQSVFVRREEAIKLFFNLKYKIAADYDMIKRIYENHVVFKYVDIAISTIDAVDGLSANNRSKQRREVAEICNISDTFYFRIYNLKEICKGTMRNMLHQIFKL